MKIINTSEINEYQYDDSYILSSIKKKSPYIEENSLDNSIDIYSQTAIRENILSLQSENEFARTAALIELIKFIKCCPTDFQNIFPPEAIQLILNIFNSKVLQNSLDAINFLGFLTYFNNSFSGLILSSIFLNSMVEIIPHIQKEESFSDWCTLLANLFFDIPNYQLYQESNLSNVLTSVPEQFFCSEYLRLVMVLCSIKDITSSDSSVLLKILMDCIANLSPLYIKALSLKNLRKLLKTERKKELQNLLPPMMPLLLRILTECNDIKVVLNDLKLIRKLFCSNSIIVDYLFNVNFYNALRKVLDYDNPDVKYEVLKTIIEYIKVDSVFDQAEASIFLTYDFNSDLNNLEYKSKVLIVNLEGLLFHYLPIDSFVQSLNEDFFESIFDIFDSNDYAKVICYKFLIDLLNKVIMDPDLFSRIKTLLSNGGFLSVSENDLLNSKEEIKSLAQLFLKIFNDDRPTNEK